MYIIYIAIGNLSYGASCVRLVQNNKNVVDSGNKMTQRNDVDKEGNSLIKIHATEISILCSPYLNQFVCIGCRLVYIFFGCIINNQPIQDKCLYKEYEHQSVKIPPKNLYDKVKFVVHVHVTTRCPVCTV